MQNKLKDSLGGLSAVTAAISHVSKGERTMEERQGLGSGLRHTLLHHHLNATQVETYHFVVKDVGLVTKSFFDLEIEEIVLTQI